MHDKGHQIIEVHRRQTRRGCYFFSLDAETVVHQSHLVHADLVGHYAHGVAVVVAEVDATVFAIPTLLEPHLRVDAPSILIAADEGVSAV